MLRLTLLAVSLAGCAVSLAGCAELGLGVFDPARPHLDLHIAEIAGRSVTFDEAEWKAHGQRDAILSEAERRLGCARALLTVEARHSLFVVDGCGGGLFADVISSEEALPPRGFARKALITHWFVDVARDDSAALFGYLVAHSAPSDERAFQLNGEYFGAGLDLIRQGLDRLAQRVRRGAADLDCARARVAVESVNGRGIGLRLAEGCGRRATYVVTPAGDRLISLVAAADGKLGLDD